MKRFFTIAMLAAFTGALSAGERDVVKPLIADKLISARLTQQEMTGGEIDRRMNGSNRRLELELGTSWVVQRTREMLKC